MVKKTVTCEECNYDHQKELLRNMKYDRLAAKNGYKIVNYERFKTAYREGVFTDVFTFVLLIVAGILVVYYSNRLDAIYDYCVKVNAPQISYEQAITACKQLVWNG